MVPYLIREMRLPSVYHTTMRPIPRFALALFILSLTGCSTFEVRYQAALANRAPSGVEGAWEGRWESQGRHGGDRLRAVVVARSPQVLHVVFRAHFWGIFDIDEEVDLNVTGTSPVHAAGQADLGYFKGGMYEYDATITPTQFDATYKSKYDHGTFILARPKSE